MMRQQVASTATGSPPATSTPAGFGAPWIGPLPSMPTMPSTIANWRGKAACRSAMRFVDAGPVQHVLGPAVDAAGHHAEQILHRERRARPVMGLHLGHGDQQVGAQRGVGQVELLDARELRASAGRA